MSKIRRMGSGEGSRVPSISPLVTLLLAVLVGMPLAGTQLVLHPESATQILDPETAQCRILLAISLPEAAQGMEIMKATLEFDVPSQIGLTTFELYPIAGQWNPSTVSWSYPWLRPGGDFTSRGRSRFTFTPTGREDEHVVLGLGEGLELIQAGVLDNLGFLLMPMANEGVGFSAPICQVLVNPEAFLLTISIAQE